MCIIQNINLQHAKCGVCVHCMWKSLETGRDACSTGGSESSVFLAALRLLQIHLAILQLKAFLVLIFLCLFPDMKSTQVLCSPEPFGVMRFTLCGSSVPHAGGLLTIWVQLLIFFQGDLHLQSLCSGNHHRCSRRSPCLLYGAISVEVSFLCTKCFSCPLVLKGEWCTSRWASTLWSFHREISAKSQSIEGDLVWNSPPSHKFRCCCCNGRSVGVYIYQWCRRDVFPYCNVDKARGSLVAW